jgi:hypothetical protein
MRITPPAAPPAAPPVLELNWPALPPAVVDVGSANSTPVNVISEEMIFFILLILLVAASAVGVWYLAIQELKRGRERGRGTSARDANRSGGEAPTIKAVAGPAAQITFTRPAGPSPPSRDMFTETGRVSSPLPPELRSVSRAPGKSRLAVQMAEASTTMHDQVALYSAVGEAREGGWTSGMSEPGALTVTGGHVEQHASSARRRPERPSDPPRRSGAPSLLPLRFMGAPPVLPPRAPRRDAISTFSDARAPPNLVLQDVDSECP